MRLAIILLYLASSLIRLVLLLIRPGIPPVNLMIALIRIAYSLTNAARSFFHPDVSIKKWQNALSHLKTWLQKLEEATTNKKQQLAANPARKRQKTSLAYFDWILKKCYNLVLSFEKSLLGSSTKKSPEYIEDDR